MASTLALHAQPLPTATAAKPDDRAALVDALARELTDAFVFPEVGLRYASAIRAKQASGAYAGLAEPDKLASAITADLQAVAKDGHLKVFTPDMLAKMPRPGMRAPVSAVSGSGWLADGVAYVGFTLFPGDAATLKLVDDFIATHARARVLIIDARAHRGGGLAEMDRLFAQLFSSETALVAMDTREAVERERGSPVPDGPTLRRAAAPSTVVRRVHYAVPATQPVLSATRVYLLTSGRTASAAEHLALALKRTGRGTLVGETTAGAGHFGGMAELPGGYGVFVPVGRTFDPATGRGWEGTGVAPDVPVPAAQALDKALELAGVDKTTVTRPASEPVGR